ncbi:MAG: hypothetical protein E3K37_16460, partial [Candidatus Kuenenia sp.]|nr:hypothetical protein [Candidatus Kuenenia hertensis]
MFKKFGIGVVVSGALMFGYCALGTVFISTALAEEEGEKKDDELMSNGHLCIASINNEEGEEDEKKGDELMDNGRLCTASISNEEGEEDEKKGDELMDNGRL